MKMPLFAKNFLLAGVDLADIRTRDQDTFYGSDVGVGVTAIILRSRHAEEIAKCVVENPGGMMAVQRGNAIDQYFTLANQTASPGRYRTWNAQNGVKPDPLVIKRTDMYGKHYTIRCRPDMYDLEANIIIDCKFTSVYTVTGDGVIFWNNQEDDFKWPDWISDKQARVEMMQSAGALLEGGESLSKIYLGRKEWHGTMKLYAFALAQEGVMAKRAYDFPILHGVTRKHTTGPYADVQLANQWVLCPVAINVQEQNATVHAFDLFVAEVRTHWNTPVEKLPPCSDEARWKEDECVKVYEGVRKTATKVFRGPDAASQAEQLAAKLKNARVEAFPAAYKKCVKQYCDVWDYCPHKQGGNDDDTD